MQEFRIPKHVTFTFFNESAVLLDSRKNAYYALNESAADFWQLLSQMGSYEKALQQMLESYDNSGDVITKDMEELVNSLVKSGLLEKV
ncbi:MAG: PqqD family protein [Scytonematopsis contorta HA4267-MV1]|jgi:hypothetical protein|nr:PqqD family protein [Scytonematopsis contorta HA4267-MV1]